MTSRAKLRVGIVGTGMVGSIHARSARLAGAELVAVAAASEASAREAADRLGAARGYADAFELIADPGLDVVHVCTPNDLHFELASAAIAAGKHVVCEKPLAIGLERAETLRRLAAEVGVIAAVPFVYRFYPMVREARARVAAGELGSVGLIGGAYLQDWLLPPESSNWRVDAARGGPSRAFADIGSHWCDLVEFVSGQRIAALSAQMRTLREERPAAAAGTPTFAHREPVAGGRRQAVETEDVAVLSFRTDEDAPGAVLVSQVSAGHKNGLTFELTGTSGTIRFDQQAPDSLLVGGEGSLQIVEREARLLHPAARRYVTLPAGHPQGYHDCFDAFVADVYGSIAADAPVEGLPTFADGVRAVALTSAALASAGDEAAWVGVDTFADKEAKLS